MDAVWAHTLYMGYNGDDFHVLLFWIKSYRKFREDVRLYMDRYELAKIAISITEMCGDHDCKYAETALLSWIHRRFGYEQISLCKQTFIYRITNTCKYDQCTKFSPIYVEN